MRWPPLARQPEKLVIGLSKHDLLSQKRPASFEAAVPACRRSRESIEIMPEANGDENLPISEREARQTGQVLHVIMRDLNPTR